MAIQNPAMQLSARLLCLNAQLALLADPREGPSALVRPLGEEMTRLMEKEVYMPKEVRQLLTSAVNTLSSSSSTISYTSLISAIADVAVASKLLAINPPSSPPSHGRLPTELVAHIVQLLQQEPNARLRQHTNTVLARTTRGLYKLVQPILNEEVVVGTPQQFDWFRDKVEKAGDDEMSHIKRLYVDLKLEDIERQKDGRWIGRSLLPTLDRFFELVWPETLSVNLTPLPLVDPFDFHWTPRAYPSQVEQACGMDEEGWWNLSRGEPDCTFPNVVDLTLPNAGDQTSAVGAIDELYDPPEALRRLRLGCDSPPAIFSPASFRNNREDYDTQVTEGKRVLGFRYEVLAIPFHTLYPYDFLPLITPLAPSTTPTITHLEVTFRLVDLRSDLSHIANIISTLSPSLRRLALRVKFQNPTQNDCFSFADALRPALKRCTLLEHLELGGSLVDGTVIEVHRSLPHLRKLVVLPFLNEGQIDEYSFGYAMQRNLQEVKAPMRLVFCRPPTWPEWALRQLAESCDGFRVDLVVEDRPDEYAWLAHEGDL